MADLLFTGNSRNTILDNNLVVSSDGYGTVPVFVVDTVNNKVAVNKTTPTIDLDIAGSTAISSALTVQTNKFIVDSSGKVGINITPSANQFEVSGNVSIVGSLFVAGSVFTGNTSALDIQDSNITLNKNGNDASAASGGLTIQRTTTNALLTWNNTKSNFEAGLSAAQTSLIRAGGNTDAAIVSVGTSDNFTLTLKANNVSAIQVATTGDVTILNDLSLSGASSDILVQGVSIRGGNMPPGTVISFMPGYYINSTNGTFTPVLSANTASAVNTWLTTNGYSQWRVCDGTNYGADGTVIAGSAIFTGGNQRYVPNLTPALTNERFLEGSTLTGSTGGTNTFTHAHSLAVALASTNIDHSHVTDAQTGLAAETISLNPFAGNTAATDAFGASDHGPLSHNHSIGSHSHGDNNFAASENTDGSSVMYIDKSGSSFTAQYAQVITNTNPAPSTTSRPNSMNAGHGPSGAQTGNTSSSFPPTTPHNHSYPHSHDMTHTHVLPSANHNHSVTPHTHAGVTAPFASNTFSHDHTGTTDNGTPVDNRPQYLTCFDLMKVL